MTQYSIVWSCYYRRTFNYWMRNRMALHRATGAFIADMQLDHYMAVLSSMIGNSRRNNDNSM